jgi:hypothetical protein
MFLRIIQNLQEIRRTLQPHVTHIIFPYCAKHHFIFHVLITWALVETTKWYTMSCCGGFLFIVMFLYTIQLRH